MKMRHMLSGLLVMLLLCGSSWSAACDLSCGLEQSMPMQARGVSAPAGVGMPMAHCHGMMQRQSAGVHMSSACPASECGHRVVPAERGAESGFDVLWTASEPVAVVVRLMAPVVRTDGIALTVPRGDPYGFDPLLVSLRV